MNSVLLDFETRSKEVEGYFNFVLRLAAQELSLQEVRGNTAAFSPHERDELLKRRSKRLVISFSTIWLNLRCVMPLRQFLTIYG
jgi:hypothetical protein